MGQITKNCPDFCENDEYCDRETGNCMKGCSWSINCSDGLVCNQQIHKCTEGCRTDEDCHEKEFCSILNSQCTTGCRGDHDCKAKEICDLDHKCVPGCISNSHCNLDEFCNGRICVKNCFVSPCGQNSKCSAGLHEELCSCLDGFFPEKEIGCRQNQTTDVAEILECSDVCGPNSKCISADNEIYCFCPKPNTGNPYVGCQSGSGTYGGSIKPTGEIPLSAACIATLCVG